MPETPVSFPSWSAPSIAGPIDWTVRVPGSKSATARALYLAAVADEPTQIYGALSSRDTDLMADALRALGAQVSASEDSVQVVPWDLTGALESKNSDELTIHVGLAGTVMRFVPLLALLRPGVTHFIGDAEAEQRPLAPILDVARQLGAHVECHNREGFLPFTLTGVPSHTIFPEEISVDASASSQFLSASLLVAPLLGLRDGKPRRVRTRGAVVSMPHVQMTVQVLRDCGITVTEISSEENELSWIVQPGRPYGGARPIEPDLTNAGVFLAAAMLMGGRVRILDWPAQTTQAGDSWRAILTQLGAEITCDGSDLELLAFPPDAPSTVEQGLSSEQQTNSIPRHEYPRFKGQNWDFSDIGELTPTAVALLLFADSPSSIRGVGHIRGHETDRLAALAHEIRTLGGVVDEHPDGLSISPAPLRAPVDGRPLHAYADHRMATFAALVGLRVPGVKVDDIACTSKTLPDFPHMWARLVGDSPQERML